MPKIRDLKINLGKQDLKKYYDVTMHYSAADKKFHIVLPDELKRIYVLMAKEDKDSLAIAVGKRGPNYYSGDEISADYWVLGITETACEEHAKEVFAYINEFQVERRNVIVIDFDGRDSNYYHRDHNNPEHPEIGMTLGLLYCCETKAGTNGQVNYTRRKVLHTMTGEETIYEHLQLGSKVLAIDDTPENRLFLEGTYSLLANLREKMITHFNNSNTILELISSNQKLLG